MDESQILYTVQKLCNKAYVPIAVVNNKVTSKVAGYFHAGKNSFLDFNLKIAKENPDTFIETVIHEVAHYVRYVRNGNKLDMLPCGKRVDMHGTKWKAVMNEFGIENPQRCHSYKVESTRKQRKWEYECGCSKHRISTVLHNRMQNGQRRLCNSCKGGLEFTGKLIED